MFPSTLEKLCSYALHPCQYGGPPKFYRSDAQIGIRGSIGIARFCGNCVKGDQFREFFYERYKVSSTFLGRWIDRPTDVTIITSMILDGPQVGMFGICTVLEAIAGKRRFR